MTLYRGKRRGAGAGVRRRTEGTPSRRSAPPVPPPYSVYRLAIQLDDDATGAKFSKSHPELRIEIQNRMEVGSDQILMEGSISGPGAIASSAEWAEEVRGYPEVVEVEMPSEQRGSVHYRLTRTGSRTHGVLRHHRILTRYPIVVQNGWMRLETVATAAQIRSVLAELRKRVGPSHVEAIRRGSIALGSLGLGPAQETVFRAAMTGGYFDLPRGVSVTGLAERLGLSKSAVSESLTRIEKRLAEAALQLELA